MKPCLMGSIKSTFHHPPQITNNKDAFYIEIANISFILIKKININENSF